MAIEFFYRSALEHINEGVFFVAPDGKLLYLNPPAARMCGIDEADATDTPLDELFVLHDVMTADTSSTTPLSELLAHAVDGPVCGRFFLQHPSGHRLHIEMRLLAVHTDEGEPVGIQGILTDASAHIDLSQINRCLHKLIRVDSLTHLPNLRAFADALTTEYLRYARYGIPFAMIATTLDGLKQLPDQTASRDSALQWYARQLTGALRKSDTSARIRGNLFFILLPHTDAAAAARAARKIQERMQHFPCPQGTGLTASFGCSAISRQDTLDRLQERTRKALHKASSAGENQVQVL